MQTLRAQPHPGTASNLLGPGESYKVFLQTVVKPARDMLHAHGLKVFHELHAAYACERYEYLSGSPAPVNAGQLYRTNRMLEQAARQQISHELGHNRIDVVSAYIGSRL